MINSIPIRPRSTRAHRRAVLRQSVPLHLMMLAPMFMIFLFSYVPMVGIVIAFQDFIPTKGFWGSEWIYWENFEYLFALPRIWQIIRNTLEISVLKIVATIGSSILFALLVSEVRSKALNKAAQSIILFPWFISWVILGNVFKDAFALNGVANRLIVSLGGEAQFFFGDNRLFRVLLITTDVWKNLGYNMVILLTAIAGIDATLYEAATIDGANRFQQKLHITLPSIMPMIMLLLTLSLGGILNAGFEQVLVLYNNAVLESAEVLDTYIYKLGFYDAQYALSTAAGLFKSLVGCVCLCSSYYLAYRCAGYQIF